MSTYSLFDLQNHLRRVIALNYAEPLWITAEIAQQSRSRGHIYLDLVQKGAEADGEVVAQAQAVLWQRDHARLRMTLGLAFEEVLREGCELRMLVRVDYHERYGMRLALSDLDPAYTYGRMELQRRQTVQTLRQSGLLERNKALPLPAVLQRIAVVSSEGAAGFQDFRAHIENNPFGYRFDCRLFSSAVQGQNLESELIAALGAVTAQRGSFDCVAILRGGGARLDLAGFDRLELCKAAATLPLPVLTGIGHDVDETVLDLVAHRALKTPTAVADFLLQHNLAFETSIMQLADRVQGAAREQLKSKALELAGLELALRWGAQARTRAAALQLNHLAATLPEYARQNLRLATGRLDQAEALCAALDPAGALRRGFSLTLKQGKVVTAAGEVAPGDILETQLRDGKIVSIVAKG